MKRLDALTILRKAMDGKIEKNFLHYHIKASTIADLGFGFLVDIRALCHAQENYIGFLREAIILNAPSRNQAKRLRTRVRLWLDAEIAKELAAQCAERGQAAFEAGEELRTVMQECRLQADPKAFAEIFNGGRKTPNSFPPADLGQMPNPFTQEGRDEIMQQSQAVPPFGFPPSHGNRMAQLIAARKAKEAAKDAEIEQLKADLEAANLTKDGAIKLAGKAIAERDELRAKYENRGMILRAANDVGRALFVENENLKATNAELVRQAQAHNQEAIQLREALENMTRLRNEALGKSVRLPKEGEVIEYRNTESAPWKTYTVAVHPYGRPHAPDEPFGIMYLCDENHGILWRWPAKKERTAADAKLGDLVKFWGHTNLLTVHKIEGKMIWLLVPVENRIIWTSTDYFCQTWRFAD